MAQVRRDAFVVELGRDVLPRVTVVACCVVDEYACRTVCGSEGVKGASRGLDVAQVAQFESDLPAGGTEFRRQRRSMLVIEVDESNPRALFRKRAHHLGANAGRTAGDEDACIFQAWVGGERRCGHGCRCSLAGRGKGACRRVRDV